MKMILLAMLLTACGAEAYQPPTTLAPKAAQTEPAPETANQPETRQRTVAQAAPAAEPNVAVSARPALAVAGMADLPLCNVNDEGWIIYVQSEKSLLACLGGDWQAVDVRGADGVKGDTGAQGEAGKDGKDGAQGVKGDTGIAGAKGDTGAQGIVGIAGAKGDTGAQGVAGEDGSDGAQGIAGVKGDTGAQGIQGVQGEAGLGAIPGVGLYWTDPDVLRIWIIVSSKTTFGGVSCPAGFSLPTYVEQLPVKFHEYFSAYEATLPNGVQFWTSTLNGGRWVQTLQSYAATVESSGSAQHMFICHN